MKSQMDFRRCPPGYKKLVACLSLVGVLLFILILGDALWGAGAIIAYGPDDYGDYYHNQVVLPLDQVESKSGPPPLPAAPGAACTNSYTVEGSVDLDNCYAHNLTVNGINYTISVYYSLVTTTVTVDDVSYNHWIASEAQAIDVAEAVEEAWQAVFTYSSLGGASHQPYLDSCGNNLDILMRDGKGWSGIAYWGSPGSCRIGIDAPMVLGGVGTNDDGVIAHEIQHYLQFAYDDGCYDHFRPLYPGSSLIEGWANWAGKNATSAALDASYSVSSYNASLSYYDLSYTNLKLGYDIQQYGGNGAPADPGFGINEVYEHYRKCDLHDNIFVFDETIMALTGGAKNEEIAFLDFLAAYYAYPFADPITQPELVFPDADDKPTGRPAYSQDVNMSGGSQSWIETTPDDWAGRYYRITPQAGCDYVQLHVETTPPGGKVGLNFMAADTATPTLLRSAHIGDNATRLFAGAGSNDELVVVVNAFDTASTTYEVEATCVTPTVNILEPTQIAFALAGAPDSPIAILTRIEVTSGGLPVSGIVESQFNFDAEGDAPTVIAGSFQEVGPGEYWAIIMPPVKPAGTTFVDYQVCLDGICDTEIDALLYADPGNSDLAIVIDASGSMNTEDTLGEGTRLINAQKAAKVIPDLLRDGDRILVMDFSAIDNPPGCGLPPDGSGDGNCPLDLVTYLARIDVTAVNLTTVISSAKTAIDMVSAREWTPIGGAVDKAKDDLLAAPFSLNPKSIFLLSDGRENVNPLWNDIKAGVIGNAVVDTIGFGPEAPGNLLAQIAADTGGTYRPVPTSGLGTSRAMDTEELIKLGLPEPMAKALSASPFLPGQLELADVYSQFETEAQDGSRLFNVDFTTVPDNTWQEWTTQVDKTANRLRFVVAGKQEDGDVTGSCAGYHRQVEVAPPNPADPQRPWIPISPVSTAIGLTPPANWDIRNSVYDDVLVVTNPDSGAWRIRTKYTYIICKQGQVDETETQAKIAASPEAFETDFMLDGSVQSTIQLEGRFLGLDKGLGVAGDTVPIVATLVTRSGLISGALVVASVQNEGGTDFILLRDDGNNHDGMPGDGIYGWDYSLTSHGGSYGVRILASFPDPANPAVNLIREWNGGFWIDGPQVDRQTIKDRDQDGLPDDYEERYDCLDPDKPDSSLDPDQDWLPSLNEFTDYGTNPCRADTDQGGEHDGSEVEFGRNPLWPDDDEVNVVGHLELRPLNNAIWVNWRPTVTESMKVYISTVKGQLGDMLDMGTTGSFSITALPNGQSLVNGTPYYLTFSRMNVNNNAEGAYSDQFEITPKEDPIPPSGAFLIGGPNVTNGGDVATARQVTLLIDATDVLEYEGAASHAVPHAHLQTPGLHQTIVSGNVEMRFHNDIDLLPQATWESLADEKVWTLDCEDGEYCTVYGQFRDGAGNESLVIDQAIQLQLAAGNTLYLPLIRK